MATACAVGPRPEPISVPAAKATHLRIKPDRGPVRRVALEDYVRGTMLSEFDPPSGDPAIVERMFEVQAVIARTYAVAHVSRHRSEGFDLCSTIHCQLFQPERLKRSMWTRHVERAAGNTDGMVLWHEGGPARALFHSDCGGHTSAANDVWDGPARAYLNARRDDGPAEAAHTSWRFEVEPDALAAALNRAASTRVGRRLTDIRIAARDGAGRAQRITIVGTRRTTVRGEELRSAMNRAFGVKALRSTMFEVSRKGRAFVFVGRGYGHGVGLCQTGAYARLSAGAQLEYVLARYYPGTRLVVLR